MNVLFSRGRPTALVSVLCLLTVGRGSSQTTGAGTDSQEETVALSPFVVDANSDQNGYRANSTLAGTRVRTDLKDIPSAISVITTQFLQDTGATNNADLLVYTPSTEVAGLRGNFSGVAGSPVYQENTLNPATRVRGLDAADNTRNYFLTDIPWDSFNVGRVDLQRGPNSLLFGVGSPAGIINTSTNDASFRSTYNFENRIDEWGSLRNSANVNQNLIKNVLAIRVSGVEDDQKFEQKAAYNNSRRVYAAVRFDPKLLASGHTSIRANYEDGRIRSDNPRQLPPLDLISPWFRSGADPYGNPGYNKLTINQYIPGNASNGNYAGSTFNLGGWAQGRAYWPDVANYFDNSGTPIKTITSMINQGKATGGGIAGLPTYRPLAIPPFGQYAANVGMNSSAAGAVPGSPIPGGAYFADVVLTDPSIFNFYKKLLDGDNKQERQNWKALNVAIDQGFFNDRLNFEVALDHQDHSSYVHQFLSGSNYAISVDVNQVYADNTPNPNVGRPYVANAESFNNNSVNTIRDTARFITTGEIHASDFMGDTTAAKIIGKHSFTGLFERNTIKQSTVNWAQYATTPAFILDNNRNDPANPTNYGQLNSNRSFEWLAYLGPSLATAPSAAGANLSNLNYLVQPPLHQTVRNFNSTWAPQVNPATGAPYLETDPYTSTNYGNNTTNATDTQKNNPANYVGWQAENIDWLNAKNPSDFPSVVQSALRTRYRDISKGITWQGYFLDGDLVANFGWRKDSITNYQTASKTDQVSGFTSLSFPDDPKTRTDISGTSKSWGGVYHFPKKLTSSLPGDMTFSLLFNHSDNFKADATRLSLSGVPIDNARGTTTEAGAVVTALNDRLTLKVDWFKTKVANASFDATAGNSIAGLGGNGYWIADAVIWGYGWAAALQDGLRGQTPGSTYWDYALGSNLTPGTPAYAALNAQSAAIVDAWLHNPLPATFFSSYNLNPELNPTIGAKTGNLRDSYPGGLNDANGPVTGGGSQFGNHFTTVDNLSKGIEIELTAQPVKNWNLTANYSHIKATHTNIDAGTQAFMAQMTKFFSGPAGQLRMWGNNGNLIGPNWIQNIIAPYTVELNAQGKEAPEVSPWRLNLITSYSFDHGPVKGLFFGGAVRIEAGRILGYKYDPNFKNINANDPAYATVPLLTKGGLNVDMPFRGKSDEHLDIWFGYTTRLTKVVNWRIQANVRSVGEKDRLTPSRIQPDGSLALERIQLGMNWQLTNSFDF